MCELCYIALRKSRNENSMKKKELNMKINIKLSERKISEVVEYIDRVLNCENWNLNYQNTR